MADKIEDGGPAFPVEVQTMPDGSLSPIQTGHMTGWAGGVSKREWFAAQAMIGFLPVLSIANEDSIRKIAAENGLTGYVTNADVLASVAYGYADAMIRKGRS